MRCDGKIHSLLKRCEEAYRSVKADKRGLLLAVSGGADSTALLLATFELRAQFRTLEVVSLDHGLRPESAQEVASVEATSRRLGLPFHSRSLGLRPGSGIEARARAARYHALDAVARERGLDFVATAHTASDQAETLLM